MIEFYREDPQSFAFNSAKFLLKKDKQNFYKIANTASELIVELTLDWHVIFTNKMTLSTYGWGKKVTTKNFLLLQEKYDQLSLLKKHCRSITNGIPMFGLEVIIKRPSENLKIVLFDIELVASNGVSSILLIGRDVTKIKQLDRAKDRFSIYYSHFAPQFQTPMWWKDANHVYRGCNQIISQEFGYSTPSELVGKTDKDTPCSEEEVFNFWSHDDKTIALKEPIFNIVESMHGVGGKKRGITTSKIPILHKKSVVGTLGFYCDLKLPNGRQMLHHYNKLIQKIYMSFSTNRNLTFLYNNTVFYLTHREAECLEYLQTGKTMKETARLMNISHRTVEYFIKCMKNKTDCTTKELISSYTNFQQL